MTNWADGSILYPDIKASSDDNSVISIGNFFASVTPEAETHLSIDFFAQFGQMDYLPSNYPKCFPSGIQNLAFL